MACPISGHSLYWSFFWAMFSLYGWSSGASPDGEEGGYDGSQRYKIEGKITIPFTNDQDWLSMIAITRVILDGGHFLGFLRYRRSAEYGAYFI